MKKLINQLFILSILLTGVIVSCNSKKTEEEKSADATNIDHHEGEDHVHDFACPMHPDMRGHEGEKCNICGMPLEHMEHAPVAGNYTMEFKASEPAIVAGKEVSLSFTPRNKDNTNALVPLDVEHEKKIHLITVSQDLSWFDHIHPEYQADGSYVVNETFPHGGKYLLYADYKPSGSTHQLEKIAVDVEGKTKPTVNYTTEKTNATSGEFSVVLKPDLKEFLSNQEIHFDGQFSKGGKRFDVNNLQAYLGAKGHMVAIHIQNKTYVHLHPEVENDILHFHATFPEAGMYRGWLQFMAEDKLHTVDFTIMVEQGSEEDAGKDAHDEEESDHDH
jgi:hypothetical protein